MSDTYNIHFDIKDNIFADIKILKASFISLEERIGKIEGTSKKSFETLNEQVSKIKLSSVIQNFNNLSDALGSVSAPGLKFNASMTELKAMAGLTEKELANLGAMARENAKTFGGDAAKSVETYKLLIAQLGPEIAKQPKILNDMAKNAEILAKSMNGDVVGAAGVLSTAMHQYGVDLSDAKGAQIEMTKMMNAMSASANAGASELPSLQQAVGVAGGSAQRAGLQFEEMLTAIQFLDNASYKASEGGTALRAVLEQLSKGRFLSPRTKEELSKAGVDVDKLADKTVSFTDKMRMLQPIAHDTALIGALFGGPYAGAAQALIATADAQDKMTASIKGTTEAEDYAATMMESKEEKLGRMKARIDDVKVSLFEYTNGTIAYLQPVSEMLRDVTSLSPILDMARGAFSLFKKETYANIAATKTWQVVTKGATVVQRLFNAAMRANPIGMIITGVVALTAGIYGLSKALQFETTAQRINNEVKQRVIEKTADQRAELNQLFFTLKNAKKGSDEYNNALRELERIQPGIVDKYNLQAGAIRDINAAQKEMIANLDVIAKAEALKEIAKEKHKEALLKEQEGPTWKDYAKAIGDDMLSSFTLGATKSYSPEQYQMGRVHDNKKEAEYASKELAKLQQTSRYKAATGSSQQNNTPSETNTGNDGTVIEGLNPNNTKISNTGNESSSGKTSTTVDKRNITVKIDRLVENLTVSTTNLKEGLGEVKKQVTEALVGAVRDFEVAL